MTRKRKKKVRNISKQILEILLKGPEKQKDLADKLDISRSLVKYHLDRLERMNLIKKQKTAEVGNVIIYEVSINLLAYQGIREILDIKVEGVALITGFGLLETAYQIPDKSKRLLLNNRSDIKSIHKLVCFTTPESIKIRELNEKKERLIPLTQLDVHSHEYEEYRRYNSDAFRDLEDTILNYIQNYRVFLDLTPLTKLVSFRLLQYSDTYNIPSFYIGKDIENKDSLIWFRE